MMTLPADLDRIRAFAATPDIPSLTPPPAYGVSPLRGAYRPWYILQRWMIPAYLRLWEADARPVPFEILIDVRERCERINASPGQS